MVVDPARAYYERNRDLVKERAKRWASANPEKRRITVQKYNDKRDPRHLRALHLRRYGLTVEEYDELLEAQGGACAICGNSCPTGQSLSVDHCHTTGVIRGLLCRKCNSGIGLFGDSPELIEVALEYLRR